MDPLIVSMQSWLSNIPRGRQNVYFCDSIEEVQSHALQRRCVAFVSDTDVTMEAEAEGAAGGVELER